MSNANELATGTRVAFVYPDRLMGGDKLRSGEVVKVWQSKTGKVMVTLYDDTRDVHRTYNYVDMKSLRFIP
jgi:hypothetical protein